ncbi:hypothetical protein J6590_017997 [Homalodisca vitripennis]|nr:hypothetical protein J6590_017997 [Homalodisca vitripennis]
MRSLLTKRTGGSANHSCVPFDICGCDNLLNLVFVMRSLLTKRTEVLLIIVVFRLISVDCDNLLNLFVMRSLLTKRTGEVLLIIVVFRLISVDCDNLLNLVFVMRSLLAKRTGGSANHRGSPCGNLSVLGDSCTGGSDGVEVTFYRLVARLCLYRMCADTAIWRGECPFLPLPYLARLEGQGRMDGSLFTEEDYSVMIIKCTVVGGVFVARLTPYLSLWADGFSQLRLESAAVDKDTPALHPNGASDAPQRGPGPITFEARFPASAHSRSLRLSVGVFE